MKTKAFIKAWEELSPIQKKAAEWDKGALLLLAGPGSGKTKVLTCRIANLLELSCDKNFRVLGLTFTNKAADEMRSRVANFVPGLSDRLFLGTFHSFCADVLRQHGTHLGINPNFSIYSLDKDLQDILNDAVEEAKKMHDVISDLDKKTLPVIQRLKSLLILPQQCHEHCHEIFKDRDFGERMAIIYTAYENELLKHNSLDFNSLILKTHELFDKFPVFAKRYRTVYPYICIDEFQDTNQAQYDLIRTLVGDQNQNLFVVADDDQIIYQWNGASHERLKELLKYCSPMVIQLPMNYRCPPEIVALANNLIHHNFLRTADKKPLEAFHSGRGKDTVRLLECYPDFEAEAAGVSKDIKKLHIDHLGSVVVLGRNRKLLDGVEMALRHEGLPATIAQRKDEFESTPIVWLHSILRLANDGHNRSYLEAVCGSFAQLTQVKIDVEDVISQAQALSMGYLQSWISLCKQKAPAFLVKEIMDAISRCLVSSRDFQAFSNSALEWFASMAGTQHQENKDPSNEIFARYDEEVLVWEEMMREIKHTLGEEPILEAFLQELQMRSKESSAKPNAIVLMTIHGAKGKEFDHVYLIGLVEDELPSFQSKKRGNKSPEMEEERRNCFVAITRTIKTLTLSYAQKYRGWSKEPSRFLLEMGLLQK